MKNTELPARRTARAPGREREMKARLLGSLVLGAIAAATVAFDDDTGQPLPPVVRARSPAAIRRSYPFWRPGSLASP